MKVTMKQEGYNSVSMTLNFEELDTILDMIGENQIAEIEVNIRKPEENNGKED